MMMVTIADTVAAPAPRPCSLPWEPAHVPERSHALEAPDGWAPREGHWTVQAALACTVGIEQAAERRARPIRSAAEYVGACRRLARGPLGDCLPAPIEGEGRVDGRLVAAGWNRYSPTAWVGGELARFLGAWDEAAPRAETVGSPYNPDPRDVADALLLGLPPHAADALRLWRRPRSDRGIAPPRPSRGQRRAILDVARALRRSSIAGHESDAWSFRALRRLGQLSPELQRVAVMAVRELPGWSPYHGLPLRQIRPTDIPWEKVAAAQAALIGDRSGRVELALSCSSSGRPTRRTKDLLDEGQWIAPLAEVLAPAYPRLPLEVARRLCLGESPVQLSGGALTRREAHLWCEDGAPEVVRWLQEREVGRLTLPPLRSVAVVRWLAAVHDRDAWGQLERPRVAYGPGGERVEWRPLDRLDEIQDEDLVEGPRTAVRTAFDRAAQRQGEAWAEKARQDHRVLSSLPPGWRPYRRIMRPLLTPAALEAEGRELSHCVGGYQSAVARGQSVILSLIVRGERSTAELTRDGQVLQHRGPHNGTPSDLSRTVLRRFVERRIP